MNNKPRQKPKVPRNPGEPPLGDLLYLINLRKCLDKIKALQIRLERAEELASNLFAELEEIISQIPPPTSYIDSSPGKKSPPPPKTPNPRPSEPTRTPRSGLPRGLHTVDVSPRVDGNYDLQLDGGKVITLPPKVGVLANKLREHAGTTTDKYIPWKATKEVAETLKQHDGIKSSVKQLVHRLRDLLEEHDEDPRVILTRRGGYRFALFKLPSVTMDDQR